MKRTLQLFLGVFCLLLQLNLSAQTYYWVGGAGNWTDLNKWAACSGCAGGAFVQVPQSFNDVVVDENSGFVATATAASRTITINSGNTLVCKSLRLATGGRNVVLQGTTRLDVYGSLWLEAGTVTTAWTAPLHFFGAQFTDSLVLATNVTLRNAIVQFEPTNTGQYTALNYKQLGVGVAGQLNMNKGTGSLMLFLSGLTTHAINHSSGSAEVRDTLSVMDGYNMGLSLTGTAVFRCLANSRLLMFSIANTAVGDFSGAYLHNWGQLSVSNTGTLNIQNARVRHSSSSYWSPWITANTSILLASGSVVEFVGRARFGGGNLRYHHLVFRDNPWFDGGAHADTLIFEKGFFSNVATTLRVGGGAMGGYLRMQGGAFYNSGGGTGTVGGALTTIFVESNTTSYLMGQCEQPLLMERIDFNFAAGTAALLSANHLRLENVRALGTEAPYAAGTNSYAVPFSINTGWNAGAAAIGLPAARYLRWVGSIPANTADSMQYGSWNSPANWADGNLHPTAMPNDLHLGGACPPTLADSVLFPDNSYVRIDSPAIETKSMIWLGAGAFVDRSIHTGDAGVLEIFGSIEWSAAMRQSFNGRTRFRAWEAYPTIRSNGKPFWWRISLEGRSDGATWTLLDSLWVPQQPNLSNTYSIDFVRGRFITQNQQIRTETMRADGLFSRYLELGSSQIYITGHNNPWEQRGACVLFGPRGANLFVIDAGTSHFHLTSMTTGNVQIFPIFIIGGGHTLHDITNYGYVPLLDRNTAGNLSIRRLIFQQSGWIRSQSTGIDSIRYLASNTVAIPNSTFNMTETNVAANMVVDSAYYFAAANIGRNIGYSTIMWLAPGATYTISHPTNHTQTLIAPNGKLDAMGNCENFINISGGNFFSTVNQQVAYVNITDNTSSSALFEFANSNTNGITTGWTGVAGIPRRLYWHDGSVAASKQQWNSPRSWSLADGLMLDMAGGNDINVGNCPPTRVDTVIFTDGSFGNAVDTVEINIGQTAAECADMRWLTVNKNPVFLGAYPQQLHIHASLEFSRSMQQRYLSDVLFTGNAGVRTIRSNNQLFRRVMTFNAAGAEWRLLDSLYSPTVVSTGAHAADGQVFLQQGTLNLNGQYAQIGHFVSTGALVRQLNISNSQLHILGFFNNGHPSALFAYYLTGSNYSVSANNSKIVFRRIPQYSYTASNPYYAYMRMETGNNMQYDSLVWLSNNLDMDFLGTNTRINYLETNRDVTFRGTNNFIHQTQALNATATFNIQGSNHTIDSIYFQGNGSFTGNHRYTQLLRFSPNKVYQFQAAGIQHLSNGCDFQAIGTGGGGEITFRSSLTNSQAYIRKDSARVCVDFIYMRDIWAIGNGLSTESACVTPLCDTVLASSTTPDIYTAGRARFQAGANADNQGNNAGWDFSPYPPVPQLSLQNANVLLCPNDSTQAVFFMQGALPMDVRYQYTVNGVSTIIDSLAISPVSGSGTAADPYRWVIKLKPDSGTTTRVEALEVAVDRCFNNRALGAGVADVTVAACYLPLELVQWSVDCQLARWQVARSEENSLYTIESSSDGVHFTSVSPAIRSNNQTHFEYALPAHSEIRYYRLRKDEQNGEHFYSPIYAADCRSGAPQSGVYHLYPNPNKGAFFLQNRSTAAPVALRYELFDAQGRLLEQANLPAQSLYELEFSLPAGLYLLRLHDGQTATNLPFVRH